MPEGPKRFKGDEDGAGLHFLAAATATTTTAATTDVNWFSQWETSFPTLAIAARVVGQTLSKPHGSKGCGDDIRPLRFALRCPVETGRMWATDFSTPEDKQGCTRRRQQQGRVWLWRRTSLVLLKNEIRKAFCAWNLFSKGLQHVLTSGG